MASVKGLARMLAFRNLKASLFVAAWLLVLQPSPAAQSGRKQPPPLSPVPPTRPAPTPMQAPVDTTGFEKIKLLVSRGLDDFVRDLNEQGRLGYRLEKSVSYGDPSGRRKYAAVLRLDPGHTYDYTYDRMPDSVLYGHPLDYHARRGYQPAEAYPLAKCWPAEYGVDPDPTEEVLKSLFGTSQTNVFLFMRRDGSTEQTREYKLFTGQVGLGENLRETIQAAIDGAPPGFRPVRLLFAGAGSLGGVVSVVLERDLAEAAPEKVGYRVVRESRDLVKEINGLAAEGAHYVAGGRIGAYKVALLAHRSTNTSDYTFIDDNKAAKRFDKLIAAGYSYQGMMRGNLECEFEEVASQKLVFAVEAAGPFRRYKLLRLPEPKAGKFPAATINELQRLVGEGFQVREVFYAKGLHVILEQQTGARLS